MKTYIYCSYKFSPVGFQMGAIEYNPQNKNDYFLSKGNINKFVMSAFDEGIVQKAYGLLSNSNKYVYLIKKLQKNGVKDENEGEIDIYMNFAFEFDRFEDYNNFSSNFENLSKEEAAEECAKFIIPDRKVETYALKVNASAFNAFMARMLKTTNGFADDKRIYIEVVPSKPQEEKLASIFNLEFENLGEKKYCHPSRTQKKKTALEKKSNAKMIPFIIAAIITMMIILLWKLL